MVVVSFIFNLLLGLWDDENLNGVGTSDQQLTTGLQYGHSGGPPLGGMWIWINYEETTTHSIPQPAIHGSCFSCFSLRLQIRLCHYVPFACFCWHCARKMCTPLLDSWNKTHLGKAQGYSRGLSQLWCPSKRNSVFEPSKNPRKTMTKQKKNVLENDP